MANDNSTVEADAARMELTPDGLQESREGYLIDCPECGSTVSLHRIVEAGRGTGQLDSHHTGTTTGDGQTKRPGCTAELSLELAWIE